MSKTAHTPAPWKADFGEAFHVKEQDGGRIAMLIFTAGRFGSKGRRNPDEVAANARLIAAAPDLLEALESLVNEYLPDAETNFDYLSTEGNHAQLDQAEYDLKKWQKARAAIEKAKGGAE